MHIKIDCNVYNKLFKVFTINFNQLEFCNFLGTEKYAKKDL